MTSAPATLLAARRLLIDHLNIEDTVRENDLEPGEVGIVGNAAHRGGYHCGSDRVVTNDYSVVESSRDRTGLTSYASALDVGWFRVTTPKGTFDLRHYSRWLVAQCIAGAPDTRDIREIIYSPDGKVVRRWDRLGKSTSGDDSHLYHTHESYFRDATKAGRDVSAVKRRYLIEIGVIQEDDMFEPADRALLRSVNDKLSKLDGREPIGQAYLRLAEGKDHAEGAVPVKHATLNSLAGQITAVRADLATLAGRDLVDEQAVADQLAPLVLAQLDPARIAAAIPDTMAKQVADELAARLVA